MQTPLAAREWAHWEVILTSGLAHVLKLIISAILSESAAS